MEHEGAAIAGWFVTLSQGQASAFDPRIMNKVSDLLDYQVYKESPPLTWIVLDTAAGLGPNTVHLVAAADEALIVSTPEPTGIMDAYATIKVLSDRNDRVRLSVLVNMTRSRPEATYVYGRIAAVTRHFLGLRVGDAGYVLQDDHVGEAVRRRRPFVLEYPRCPATYCVAALAGRLASDAADRPAKEGLFRRLLRLFA